MIAEAQFAINQPSNGQLVTADQKPSGLPAVQDRRLVDTAPDQSQQFDDTGLSLASPNRYRRSGAQWHNWSIYVVADQTVRQPNPEAPQAVVSSPA